MTLDLFASEPDPNRASQQLGDGAFLLPGFALAEAAALRQEIEALALQSPFRFLQTPGGHTMTVAMTNCGSLGWVSDSHGYRYQELDPLSLKPWPPMPASFLALAQKAAALAGFERFQPQVCLINRYVPGCKMSPHQDKQERDKHAPIVSISLGIPANFVFGGPRRNDPYQRIRLQHGDVVVWGGASRLNFHGVSSIPEGEPSPIGEVRYNITFRKVL